MGAATEGTANTGLEGSWLEGGGTHGLFFRISCVSQPAVKPITPIAIVETTATLKTFIRPFFT
jgi:hypothetical protein